MAVELQVVDGANTVAAEAGGRRPGQDESCQNAPVDVSELKHHGRLFRRRG